MTVQDLFGSPDTLAEPFDFFKSLRDDSPIFYSEKLKAFVVTRYDDAQYVLNKPEIFSSYPSGASASGMAAYAAEYAHIYEDMGTYPPFPTLVTSDGQIHKRYRDVTIKNFSPADMKGLDVKLLRIIDELIDAFIDHGKADLYAALCLKLPLFTMCDVLGLPRDAAPVLKRGADTSPRLLSAALETEETRLELHRQRAEMHLCFQEYIRKYRETPADNLISKIIHSPTIDGIPLNEQELISIVTSLNVGGNETTTNGLGNMFYTALTTPGLMAQLYAEPANIARIVEESLRLESAVSAMPRWVAADTELRGVTLPAQSRLFVEFASANRDERQFGCPHQADLNRKQLRAHMGFGMGPHFCLGAPLARMEMSLAMTRSLERLKNLRVDPAAPEIRHQSKFIVRGVDALPVVFES